MKTLFPSAYLTVCALFTGGTGVVALASPAAFASTLGYSLPGADGGNEVRAQYGGFFLAVALLCVLALMGKVSPRTGLMMNAVLFGGLLAGRLSSLALDHGLGAYGPVILSLFVVDATFFTLAMLALKRRGADLPA